MQLSALLSRILSGCFHRRAAWPQHNRQRCLACGSWRLYDLNQGIQGNWKPPERPQSEPSLGSGHEFFSLLCLAELNGIFSISCRSRYRARKPRDGRS